MSLSYCVLLAPKMKPYRVHRCYKEQGGLCERIPRAAKCCGIRDNVFARGGR